MQCFAAKKKILSANTTNDNMYGPSVLQTISVQPNLFVNATSIEIEMRQENSFDYAVNMYDISGKVVEWCKIKNNASVTLHPQIPVGVYFLKVENLKKSSPGNLNQ